MPAVGAADPREVVAEDVATVEPDRVLRDLMPAAVAARHPVAVVDAGRRLLGIVPRAAIPRVLVAPGGEGTAPL